MIVYDYIKSDSSYDAFLSRCSREGRRRNPTNWTYDSVPQPQLLCRGYTMHVLRNTDCGSAAHRNPNVEQIPIMYSFCNLDEDYIGKMLDEFGLINMPARRNANEGGNGRCGVYPDFIGNLVVGRFLSPDIIVQNPNNTQCYNRYSYCINNPLKYSDPSGWSYDNSWTHNHNVPTFNHNFLERLWGHNWSFNERQEWNALIEATGGNSLNNAGELLDLLDQYSSDFRMNIGNMEQSSISYLMATTKYDDGSEQIKITYFKDDVIIAYGSISKTIEDNKEKIEVGFSNAEKTHVISATVVVGIGKDALWESGNFLYQAGERQGSKILSASAITEEGRAFFGKLASTASTVSKGLFIFGVGLSLLEARLNGTTEAYLEAGFNIIASACIESGTPVGWVAAGMYFGIKYTIGWGNLFKTAGDLRNSNYNREHFSPFYWNELVW